MRFGKEYAANLKYRTCEGKETTMCFRPSPVKRNDNSNQVTCETCGMPNEPESTTCVYCGDPIPKDSPDDFSIPDPSHSTRII